MKITFLRQNIARLSVNRDVNASQDFSETMMVNVSRKAYVLTGTAWQMRHTKNVEINAWNQPVLFPIRPAASAIPPVNHVANVMKDLSVINMVIVLPLDSVRVCTAPIMKFTLITIIHVMKIVVQQHLVVSLQLFSNLDACAKKDSSEIKSAVSLCRGL